MIKFSYVPEVWIIIDYKVILGLLLRHDGKAGIGYQGDPIICGVRVRCRELGFRHHKNSVLTFSPVWLHNLLIGCLPTAARIVDWTAGFSWCSPNQAFPSKPAFFNQMLLCADSKFKTSKLAYGELAPKRATREGLYL